MARAPKKPDGDWMDALKLAMQIDPGLRKQREESEARDRADHDRAEREPAQSERPVRKVQVPRVDDNGAAPAPPVTTPAPVVSEFPWENPKPARDGGNGAGNGNTNGVPPKMTLNFRPATVDEPPPPAPIPMPRPAAVVPAVRPSVRIPDRFEPDRSGDRPVAGRPYLARPGPSASAIRLAAAIEPLMQLVCRLNRMKRTGVLSDRFRPESLRVEFETALTQVADTGDAGIALEQPLRAFSDLLMTRAGFPFARRWTQLTTGTVPPDRLFRQSAAEAVATTTGRDDGTWAVYYACLCLVADLIPATGDLPSGTELLDELDAGIYTRPGERHERICQQAYEGVFDQPLLPSVGKRMRSIAVASVAFLLLAVAIAVALNVLYLRQMDDSIGNVRRSLSHPDTKIPDANPTPVDSGTGNSK
jgi:hypothetical protein